MHIIETIAHCNLHCQSKHRSNITKDSSFSVACFSHIAHGVRLFEITCCQPLQQLIYLRHLDCVIQGCSCVLLECLYVMSTATLKWNIVHEWKMQPIETVTSIQQLPRTAASSPTAHTHFKELLLTPATVGMPQSRHLNRCMIQGCSCT